MLFAKPSVTYQDVFGGRKKKPVKFTSTFPKFSILIFGFKTSFHLPVLNANEVLW